MYSHLAALQDLRSRVACLPERFAEWKVDRALQAVRLLEEQQERSERLKELLLGLNGPEQQVLLGLALLTLGRERLSRHLPQMHLRPNVLAASVSADELGVFYRLVIQFEGLSGSKRGFGLSLLKGAVEGSPQRGASQDETVTAALPLLEEVRTSRQLLLVELVEQYFLSRALEARAQDIGCG